MPADSGTGTGRPDLSGEQFVVTELVVEMHEWREDRWLRMEGGIVTLTTLTEVIE